MQILVLGMHRSGTSAVSRVLNLMGAYFGGEGAGTGANEENRKGFWERRDVRALNDALLHGARCDWDCIADFDLDAVGDEALGLCRTRARQILLELDAHRPWFVKEPRLCVLLPFWRPLLEFPACVHVHRNPLEVAQSLRTRNGIPVPVGLALWEAYSCRALDAANGLPRFFVSYESLLSGADGVVGRLASWLSETGGYPMRIPRPAELSRFLVADLRRQRADRKALGSAASAAQRELFEELESLCGAGGDAAPMPRQVSADALAVLRDYEAAAARIPERAARAAQAELRRQSPDLDAQLAIKTHQLEQALRQLSQAESRLERFRELDKVLAVRQNQLEALRAEKSQLQEERRRQAVVAADQREELRSRSAEIARLRGGESRLRRESAAAAEQSERLTAQLAELRSSERTRSRMLEAQRKQFDGLQAEKSRIDAELRRLAPLEPAARDILDSARWRLGDALLSLRHRLLLRPPPPMAADTVRRILQQAPRRPDASDSAAPPDAGARRGSAAANPPGTRAATVLVISWDVGHNPFGRAYLLADALSRRYNVVLMGFQFPRYGDAVWPPLAGASIRPVIVPGSSFPEFQHALERLAPRIDADVVIACKARLPAIQLGLMLKALRNRPLIIDVDDYELSFFRDRAPLAHLDGVPQAALEEPFGGHWTRYAEQLLPFADALLVSNPALGAKFGGVDAPHGCVEIPHGRDARTFDPARFDPAQSKRRLGLGADDKVVLFVGTPRPHKGVLDVLRAVQAGSVAGRRFVVVGTPPDAGFAAQLEREGGDVLALLPDQPFERLPELLSAADLVCLMQDPDSEISRYQLPAKAIDALAMGVPVLARETPPLKPLIEAGVAEAATAADLAGRIDRALRRGAAARADHARRCRAWFLEHASYTAIAERLDRCILQALDAPRPLAPGAREFLEAQERRYGAGAMPQPRRDGIDIVMFWKQNDTGLYGRRFEMLAQYLARRPEIGRVAVFDRPISIYQVLPQPDETPHAHDAAIRDRIARRRCGFDDADNLSHHAFVFNNRETDDALLSRYPRQSAFADFVAAELERLGIDPGASVFWFYPVLDAAEELIARFNPLLRVVDVVDDQRTWPNIAPDARARITAHYEALVGGAHLALVNCAPMRESMSAFASAVRLIPNGCDLEPPPPLRDFRFERLRSLSGPKLGLVGNLEQKTDADLLRKLAEARPDCHIVLIGSTHANAAILELDALENVHFFGVVPYPEVKAWIAHFDVALVPHLDTEQTRAMHPLKMLAYAAQGVPVVCTAIGNLGEFAAQVYVAADHDAFIDAVGAALDDAGGSAEALRELARRNDWSHRVDAILGYLQPLLRAGLCAEKEPRSDSEADGG